MFLTLPLLAVLPPMVVEQALPGAPVVEPPVVEAVSAQHSIIDLIVNAGPVVQFVMLILAAMSVVSWGIVLSKIRQMRRAKGQTSRFSDIFWSSRNLEQINQASSSLTASPVAAVYVAGHRELTQIIGQDRSKNGGDFGDIENIDRALKRAKAEEVTRLEKGTTFLATTASAAPFIGLFGTVWGIMHAFMGLSTAKSTSIQAVAPGISEALIATAIGLAAAIPAAVAYNYFMQQVRIHGRHMDMFSAEFLNIARRHFLS